MDGKGVDGNMRERNRSRRKNAYTKNERTKICVNEKRTRPKMRERKNQ